MFKRSDVLKHEIHKGRWALMFKLFRILSVVLDK